VLHPNVEQEARVDTDLDTLVVALYVQVDDLLKANPDKVPWRPTVGIAPRITDAELVTLAVAQALLGFTSEARWLRFTRSRLTGLFPYLPLQPGYNKRLRKLVDVLSWLIRALGSRTSVFTDDVWLADSTPVECGRSRETAKRSDLAGFAEYGYCASHSRYFWGLRLHLLCTLHGLPIAAAVTGAKADERQVLLGMLDDADLTHHIAGTTLIADKNYYGHHFETTLAAAGLDLLRPTRKGERTRPGEKFFKPLRQTVESVFDTFKGQIDLEQHGGRTLTGVLTRIWQRVLALTAAIWHNDTIGAPIKRSLIALDH
jgi:Transposase DDE domain